MDSGLTTVLTTTMTTVRLRPVPTDQKVGDANPFARSTSQNPKDLRPRFCSHSCDTSTWAFFCSSHPLTPPVSQAPSARAAVKVLLAHGFSQRRHGGLVAGVPDLDPDCAHAFPDGVRCAEHAGSYERTA